MHWVPPAGPVGPRELRDFYAYPDPLPSRGWVRASMVSTVDGSIRGADGLSGSISNPDDRMMLATLRGLSDVVLVGAGTARKEKYRRTLPNTDFARDRAAAGQHPAPALAVVSRRGELPEVLLEGPGIVDGVPRVLAVTTTTGPGLARLRERLGPEAVLAYGAGEVDLVAAVSLLAGESGLPRVLCEGGPTLLAAVTAAGLLDELCLTTSPVLVAGEGPGILAGPRLDAALRLSPAHVLTSDGFLFTRWVADPAAGLAP